MAEQPLTAAPSFAAVKRTSVPVGGEGEHWKGCQHCHLPAVRTWSLHFSVDQLCGWGGWRGNSAALESTACQSSRVHCEDLVKNAKSNDLDI